MISLVIRRFRTLRVDPAVSRGFQRCDPNVSFEATWTLNLVYKWSRTNKTKFELETNPTRLLKPELESGSDEHVQPIALLAMGTVYSHHRSRHRLLEKRASVTRAHSLTTTPTVDVILEVQARDPGHPRAYSRSYT